MAYPPEFLDELRIRLPLSDIVGRRVKLTRRNREHAGLCPFHNEKTPSFTVSDEKGFYHCFGCGAHGDVIGFTMRAENLPFPEAVEKLAAAAGMEVPASSPQERQRAAQQASLHSVLEAAAVFFEAELRRATGRPALDYLVRRGLDEDTVARFRLGFAPEGSALKNALAKQGIGEESMIAAGLVKRGEDGRSFDFFRNRVMFPIADRRGRVIAFGGRVLGDGQPKYLNSPESPIFKKGLVLYALALARLGAEPAQSGRPGAEREAVVVEGYMDAIALHQAGFAGAVAPLGTAITETQIRELWRLSKEPILCLDGDAAGRRAALRAIDTVLPVLQPGYSLRFAALPEGYDPDSLVRAGGAKSMRSLLDAAKPLVDMVWETETGGRRFATPERRAALKAGLWARIARIGDRDVADHYRSEMKARLDTLFRRPDGFSRRRFKANPAAAPLNLSHNVEQFALRQEQVMLAIVISHPELLGEVVESLAGLELLGELDKLRHEILHLAGGPPNLDAGSLERHLLERGFEETLRSLFTVSNRTMWPFVRSEASLEEARQGWDHIVALRERRRTDSDIAAAERDLAADLSERNWARLSHLHKVRSGQDEGAGIEQVGEASKDAADPH